MSPLGRTRASENSHLKAYKTAQTPPNPTDSPSHAAKLHGDDFEKDEKEVEAEGIRPESKRPRTEAETERAGLEQSRKRLRAGPSETELRLTGNYSVPATAKAIEVPTAHSVDDFLSERNKARTMVGLHKGHRPFNNLSAPAPHAAAKVGPGHNSRANAGQSSGIFKNRPGPDGRNGGQLQFAPSTGSNVPSKPVKLKGRGDGHDIDTERSLKRQKTVHEKAPSARKSNTPQSVDDDEISEVNSQHPGQGFRRGSATSLTRPVKPAGTSEHFGGNFLKQQDQRNTIPSNKRRKPRNSDRQSLNSQSQSSPVIELDHGETQNGGKGTHQAPYSVADSQEDVTNYTSQRPKIDLDPGVFESGGQQANARGGKTAFQRANNTASNGGLRPQHQPRAPADSTNLQREQFDGHSLHGHASNAGRQSTTPPLRETFQRDAGEPARTQVRARDKMQADSTSIKRNSAAMDDSFGSMDELQGATTVQGLARTSASPQKPFGSQESGSRSAAAHPQTGQHSAHNPRRTPQRVYEAESNDPEDSIECPISEFYATSCIVTGSKISLVYDPDDQELDLCDDGRPVLLARKQCAVRLSLNEVHRVLFSKGSDRLVIKGSSTGVSNGNICLALHGYNGVMWLLARLSQVARERLSTRCIEKDVLDKTFEKLASDIKSRADSLETQRRHQNLLDRYGLEQRDMSGRADEEEAITFDYGDDQPRPSRRKAMQGGNDEYAAHKPPIQSRHFQTSEPARRSTRQSKPVVTQPFQSRSPERWAQVNRPKEWSHPVTYPAQGARRVTVEFSDLERLDEGEFLNDNIISFAMRRIEEQMAPEEKENVHFFNSYFYSFLTTKNGRKAFNYDAVKRWTKNKDIFSTRYIVVPICVDLHWFVAIICNLPELSRKLAGDDEQEREVKEGSNALDSGQVTDVEETTFDGFSAGVKDGKIKTNIEHGDLEEQEDAQLNAKEENIADSSRQVAANGKKGKRKKTPPTPRKYGPDTPSIITLDSFGSPHTAEIRFLKDYLKAEADAKRGMEFDRDALQGVTAKGIPEQTNFCDCGVYLIGYIEQFAKDPRGFVSKVLSKQLDQQADFASFDPSAKRAEVREELLDLAEKEAQADRVKKEQKRQRKAAEAAGVKIADEPAASNGAKTGTKQAPSTTASVQQSTSPSKDTSTRQSGSAPVQASTSTPAKDVSVNNTSKKASPMPRKGQAQPVKAPPDQLSDNDDDLEYAPPRALEATEQSTHGSQANKQAKQHAPETREDPDSEMLDQVPLLDGLQASLDELPSKHQEMQSSATVARGFSESSEYVPPPFGDDKRSEAPDANGPSRERGSRNAEVPDSQEAPALASKG
ncbi:cysteine proteinase [Hortaea werneckii]|nr:cysteine proteinase [Hortaea werneckii]